jgi:uncharacterized protein
MPSLADKLKSLSAKVSSHDLTPPPRRSGTPIEQVIDGAFQETPHGEVFVVESHFPLDYRQGNFGLALNASLKTIADWAGEPRLLDLNSQGFIFLDTETSGLAGGTGTYAFLVGVGRFGDNCFHLAQFFMRDPIEELAYLTALNRFLGPCSGLVTFNGKSFDVPLLNTRYITNGEYCILNNSAHVDLLPLARRLWRDRLPSRALGYLEEHILGAMRTQEDVPGWLIPTLYFDYLRTGNALPLRKVFYHNAMDILSMAALLNHMASLLENPYDGSVSNATDLIAIGKLYEDLGQMDEASRCYTCGLSYDLPVEARQEAELRLSLLEKRRDNFPAAIEIWVQAARRKQVYAFVELAKYYEHRARDLSQAFHWTQAALDRINDPGFPRIERRQWKPDLEHRLERLQRKLARRSQLDNEA